MATGRFSIYRTLGDAKDDLIVSIAGPLTHIPQALLWYGLSQAFHSGTFMYMLCVQALRLNISLMLFNLFIPCYPLDGGRIFAASLQLMKIRVDIAAKICAFVSLVCAVSIGVYGFLHDEIIAMFIGLLVCARIVQPIRPHERRTVARASAFQQIRDRDERWPVQSDLVDFMFYSHAACIILHT